MEYEFIRDTQGRLKAKVAMGQEVFGRWLSEELGTDLTRLEALLADIAALESGDKEQVSHYGPGFSLHLESEEVELVDNALRFEFDEGLEPDLSYYDDESLGGCGLVDFAQLLRAWQQFVLQA
ncbi:YacL family protein [Pseudaeromonas paramecii]|uniref:YacL family protein n=1 Tax=Pseudaeromonas paramecii TaxID=2138166 RepID=A0ABP8QB54_9GAMM